MNDKINVNEQVALILDIANQLRGPFKEDEYQNVIIPMTICRRFECILDATKDKVVEAFKKGITNEVKLKHLSNYSIYNVSDFTLEKLLNEPNKIKENFKEYLNCFNETAKSIFIQMKFFDTIDAMDKGKKLYQVVKKFAEADLSVSHVNSMQMGYIMEEIIRSYSENASAGDHFTPREVIQCLTKLLLAEGCDDLYEDGKIVTLGDFACGTGGMLSEGYRMIKKLNTSTEVELFGQDNNGWYEGIAKAEMIIKGQNPDNVKLVESTLTTDAHENQKMRLILMNPPFGLSWTKDKIGEEQLNKIQQQNKSTGWYPAGLPASSDSQMLFWQFALNKLNDENGRAAIICNGSPLFGSNFGESNIRRWLFDNDYIEAIIQFCPELFYNTSISIYALIFNKNKIGRRKDKIQIIDASSFYYRLNRGLGYKRNAMDEKKHIDEIVKIYTDFKENNFCKILDKFDFYSKEVDVFQPFQRSFKLDINSFDKVYSSNAFTKLFDANKYDELLELPVKTESQLKLIDKMEKGRELQEAIIDGLKKGLGSERFLNRDDFYKYLSSLLPNDKLISNSFIKNIALCFSKIDDEACIYKNKKGVVEADSDLKDFEIIPFKTNIEQYFIKEVYPFVKKAWYDKKDDLDYKIWCDINFNKIFNKVYIPEPSENIIKRLQELEKNELSLEEVLSNE